MQTAKRARSLTESEYLERERARDRKHELVDGVEYAMAGATIAHNRLVMRLVRSFLAGVEAGGCEMMVADIRVKAAAQRYYYPGLVVLCPDARYLDNELEMPQRQRAPELDSVQAKRVQGRPAAPAAVEFDTLLNPKIVFEVLSKTTERTDQSEKLAQYRAMPSVREIVVVDSRSRCVERYEREPDGSWSLRDDGEALRLATFNLEVSLDTLYEGVSFEPRLVDEG